MSPINFDPHNTVGKYILDGNGEAVEERDLFRWAEWFEHAERQVAQSQIGMARVSTIFLGLDMNPFRHREHGKPVLWETMVFGGAFDGLMRRYVSKADALRGHETVCETIAGAQHG